MTSQVPKKKKSSPRHINEQESFSGAGYPWHKNTCRTWRKKVNQSKKDWICCHGDCHSKKTLYDCYHLKDRNPFNLLRVIASIPSLTHRKNPTIPRLLSLFDWKQKPPLRDTQTQAKIAWKAPSVCIFVNQVSTIVRWISSASINTTSQPMAFSKCPTLALLK